MKIIPKEDIITVVETIFPEGRLISQYDFEQIFEHEIGAQSPSLTK